jgi:hypothetical protein
MRERHHYQVRFKVSEAVYHRLVRESAASGTSLSEVVRDAVVEALGARDALTEMFSVAPRGGEPPARGPLPLLEFEQRLGERFAAQQHEIAANGARLRQLEEMIDRLYFGLMLHLDEVPAHLRAARASTAALRHRAWVAAVAERVEKP